MAYAVSLLELPELRVDTDPFAIYGFNYRILTDFSFRQEFAREPGTVLARFGLTCDGGVKAELPPSLSGEELDLLGLLADIAQKRGIIGQEEIEQTLADAGYLQPALAVLILVVAVAVYVV